MADVLVNDTRIPRQYHQPAASHCQALTSTPLHVWELNSQPWL